MKAGDSFRDRLLDQGSGPFHQLVAGQTEVQSCVDELLEDQDE